MALDFKQSLKLFKLIHMNIGEVQYIEFDLV